MRRLPLPPCARSSDGPKAAAAAVAPEYLRKDLRVMRRLNGSNLSRGLIRPPIPSELRACLPWRATRRETTTGRDAGRYLLTAEGGRRGRRVRQALWSQRGGAALRSGAI